MPDEFSEDRPKEKPFLDHLEDLRGTLFKIIGAIFCGMLLSLVFSKALFVLLQLPLQGLVQKMGANPAEVGLVVLGPQKGIAIIMMTALVSGLIISTPVSLYFLAQFILPGLTIKEKGVVFPSFVISILLFLGGVAFCYFITLPMVLKLLWKFNRVFGFQNMWTVNDYLSMVTKFMIANGLIFELPLVLLVLVRLGVFTVADLKAKRKYAYFIMFVLGALLSPPDLPSMIMVAAPMLILYEISIWVAVLMKKKESSNSSN